MEKLIMNRLYSRVFAPAALANIPTPPNYIPGSQNRVPDEAREKLGDLVCDAPEMSKQEAQKFR